MKDKDFLTKNKEKLENLMKVINTAHEEKLAKMLKKLKKIEEKFEEIKYKQKELIEENSNYAKENLQLCDEIRELQFQGKNDVFRTVSLGVLENSAQNKIF